MSNPTGGFHSHINRPQATADQVEGWQLALQPGDRVSVLMDMGDVKEFTVKYAPRQLGDGTWVVGLEGRAGGYKLSRVRSKL